MAGCFVFLWVLCFAPHNPLSLLQILQYRIEIVQGILFVVFALVWHLVFVVHNLYDSKRLSSFSAEIQDVTKATITGSFILFSSFLLFKEGQGNTIFVLSFWAICTSAILAVRLCMRYTLSYLRRRGRNLRFLLIIGTNSRAVHFADTINAHPEIGFVVKGFIDADWDGVKQFGKSPYTIVADYAGFSEYIQRHVVDEVIVFLPMKSLHQKMFTIMPTCEKQGITVRYFPNNYNSRYETFDATHFEDKPPIIKTALSTKNTDVFVKELSDKIAALVLLIPLMPLFLLTAASIKLTSSGPIFFIQKRIGLNKRPFRLYKFRTMVEDAEQSQPQLEQLNEATGAAFKIKNDPRITPLGRFLRKSSIDEIPQIINVIQGDMSLVGPRPLPIRDVKNICNERYFRRFSVRPGLTCLWQVSGRHNIPFDEWMELDMQYIDRWSLWLDFKILLRTIPAVLTGKGAL